eukprot:GHVU01204063.1.p1 GENE.GHVU01204063.1~~GHVU01204063.1.p1  ORF type:complete len:321 (+),score=55.36 GHVU01204063.1:59-964(+)
MPPRTPRVLAAAVAVIALLFMSIPMHAYSVMTMSRTPSAAAVPRRQAHYRGCCAFSPALRCLAAPRCEALRVTIRGVTREPSGLTWRARRMAMTRVLAARAGKRGSGKVVQAVLLRDHEPLGRAGRIVQVKNGYFYNYLERFAFARKAEQADVEAWRAAEIEMQRRRALVVSDARGLAYELAKLPVAIQRRANTDDKTGRGFFGSVDAGDVSAAISAAAALRKLAFECRPEAVSFFRKVVEFGVHPVTVKVLDPEVHANVKVAVQPLRDSDSEEDAKRKKHQRKGGDGEETPPSPPPPMVI